MIGKNDTLDIPTLLANSKQVDFPSAEIAYALQQHLPPRVIQASGFCSAPVTVFKSVIAGCKYSVPFTKVYLQPEMTKLSRKHKSANFKLFVDDTSNHARGTSFDEVLQHLVPAVVDFANTATKLKLKLPPKAVIVAPNTKLPLVLKKELASYGVSFDIAKSARDLGVTSTAAACRPSKLSQQRFYKTKRIIAKISLLANISRNARKLFSGTAFSAATWGRQASGVSDSQVLSLERDALACSGIKPSGRCRTIALMVSYGLLGTPKSRIIRETIKAWIELLKLSEDDLIHDISLAWPISRQKVMSSTCPVNAIRGIMSNIQFILIGAGWNPVAFNCWRDEEGSQWVLTDFLPLPTSLHLQSAKHI